MAERLCRLQTNANGARIVACTDEDPSHRPCNVR